MDNKPEVEEMLNRFLQVLFDGNARIDNICYNLKYKNFSEIEEAIHNPVAHVMGQWADEVSDHMDRLGMRPKRYALPDHLDEMGPEEALDDLVKYFDSLREKAIKAIEFAEEEDMETKIFLEEFLIQKITPYRRQAEQWLRAIKAIGAETLNVHIADYTDYI